MNPWEAVPMRISLGSVVRHPNLRVSVLERHHALELADQHL